MFNFMHVRSGLKILTATFKRSQLIKLQWPKLTLRKILKHKLIYSS